MKNSTEPPAGNGQENDTFSVSVILREAREASDESLDDVANQSRISRKYLEALEEGRFSDLPGNTYTLGFIRTYADHLGLDGNELVIRYKAANENSANKTTLDFPEPLPETGIPGGAILFAGVIVAVLAYGGWYVATEDDGKLANLVSPVPERLAETVAAESDLDLPEQPALADATQEQEEVVESQPEEPAAELASPEPVIEITVVEPESEPEPAAEPEIVRDEPDTSSDDAEDIAVVVETVEVAAAPEVAPEPELEPAEVVEPASTEIQSSEPETVIETVAEAGIEVEVAPKVEAEAETTTESVDERNARVLNEAQLKALQATMEDGGDAAGAVALIEEPVVEPEQVAAVIAPETDVEAEVEAEPAEMRVYGTEASSRILITATTNSWTEVRDTVTGELLLTRLLRAGDIFHVPNRPGIVLVTGNAGGLKIMVDGRVVPLIGESGAVRHDVALDPERLKAGTAAE
jgi:cytoskeleton protein RodZ